MIRKIDIAQFGSFNDFVWDRCVRDDGANIVGFKKLNILYGRNYSGKTTLSRIFRSLQNGELPEKYKNPLFSVETDSGNVTQSQIPLNDHHIRVYNKDFIDDHLSFLRDSDGNITPFAIIGSINKEIEDEIHEIESELGSIEGEIGLRHVHATKNTEYLKKNAEKTKSEVELRAKLTNKATQPPSGIKHNTTYKDPNY